MGHKQLSGPFISSLYTQRLAVDGPPVGIFKIIIHMSGSQSQVHRPPALD